MATAIRTPVKVPGPMPTTTAPKLLGPAAESPRSISSTKRRSTLAWPRPSVSARRATTCQSPSRLPAQPCTTPSAAAPRCRRGWSRPGRAPDAQPSSPASSQRCRAVSVTASTSTVRVCSDSWPMVTVQAGSPQAAGARLRPLHQGDGVSLHVLLQGQGVVVADLLEAVEVEVLHAHPA